MKDSFDIVMRLVDRMLEAEARTRELEAMIENQGRMINVQAKENDTLRHELELAKAVNTLAVPAKPNPALENVLAKLRAGFFENWSHDDVSLALGVNVGDLRRWAEGEKEAGK